ncbi:hypothetical protein D3C80_426130 [compost metagenome]
MNGEIRVEANLVGVDAQQARADAVKRAGPGERIGHDAAIRAHNLLADAFDTAAHFGGRAAGKGHQQDTARIGARDDQVGNAVGERVGLA